MEQKIQDINNGNKHTDYTIADASTGISENNELIKEKEYFISYLSPS